MLLWHALLPCYQIYYYSWITLLTSSHRQAQTRIQTWDDAANSYVPISIEIMWLCVWPSAGRIERPACLYPCDSMWGHTWTGKSTVKFKYFRYQWLVPTMCFASLSIFTFSFMIFVSSSELEDRSQTLTTYSWLVYIHLHPQSHLFEWISLW